MKSLIMKNLIGLFVVVMISQIGYSQQIPIFSLYNENGYVINPAITGSSGHPVASVSYRDQWSGIQDRPKTFSGGYRMPIYSKGDRFQRADNFIGVGAYILYDVTGPTSYTQGAITYAYHISFAKINPFGWARFLRNSHISIGLTASVIQYRLNATLLTPEMANDQLVISADNGKVLPNAGAGIYYYYDNFYLGFSAPQLIPLKVKYEDESGAASIKKVNHFFLVVGGKIPLGGDVPRGHYHKFYIEPMVWFKTVKNAPYQYDIYTRFRYKNSVWFGTGYRSSKTIIIDAGVMINEQFKIGYAYDLPINSNRSNFGSTHEIVLSYHFTKEKRRY